MKYSFPAISPDKKVGVVALGSPLSQQRLDLGLSQLQAQGYAIAMPLSASSYYGSYEFGFTNGSKQQRLDALHGLLADPEVGWILSARGGYGVMDLLDAVDEQLLRDAKKPIVGMSDLTALLVQGPHRYGVPMIHGPSVGDAFADAFADDDSKKPDAVRSVDSLLQLLHTRPYHQRYALQVLRSGVEKQGWLLAGNLSMFCALLGTPWDLNYDGALLVLEDVGEAPFRIHRNLLQLHLAGKLDKLTGLVFGRFSKCKAAHGPTVDEVVKLALESFLQGGKYPVLSGLAMGHWGENRALLQGAAARLEGVNLLVSVE